MSELKTDEISNDIQQDSDENPQESAVVLEADAPKTPFKFLEKIKRIKLFWKLFIAAGIFIFLAFITLIIISFINCNSYFKAETGTVPNLNKLTSFPASVFSTVSIDLENIDNSKAAKTNIPSKILGFIGANAVLEFSDTTPPKVTQRNVVISKGLSPTPQMFVKNISDMSKTTVIFTKATFDSNKVGKHELLLTATDEHGNSTDFSATLTFIDTDEQLFFKENTPLSDVIDRIKKQFEGIENIDTTNAKEHGEFTVCGERGDDFFVLKTVIDDKVCPVATVNSIDAVIGQSIKNEDIVSSITDLSPVTVHIEDMPDCTRSGSYDIHVILTDSFGNTTRYMSVINVHNINTDITFEYGLDIESFLKAVFNDEFSRENLRIKEFPSAVGKRTVSLEGKYNQIKVNVNCVDTVAPLITVRDLTWPLNAKLNLDEFVSKCIDASDVTYSSEGNYDVTKEGVYTFTLVAQDASGNKTTQPVKLSVYVDRSAPVISGVKNLSYILGDGGSPDYLQDVKAFDDIDGEVKVTCDFSSVDLSKENRYKIIYYAVDRAGNCAMQEAVFKVDDPTQEVLDVENILQLPDLPNGCEVVSLAIALRYAGYNVDPLELFNKYMPKAPLREGDPWYEYVGDPTDIGYGCYAPCVETTGNAYLQSQNASLKVYDVSGNSMYDYEAYIDEGIPVIFWGLIDMNGDERLAWNGFINGSYVDWHSFSHCLVLIGYNDYNYVFCDPLNGIVEYSKEDVEISFEINYRQACIIK